jgi:RimJ/RimL family protein N-acetyltransferase
VPELAQPITTARLTLRNFVPDDLDDLAEMFASEIVCRYIYREVRNRDETAETMANRRQLTASESDTHVVNVAAVLNDTGKLIGDFMLRWSDDDHRQGEIGGSLHPDYFGHGYAAEIYRELLVLGFDTYERHRLYAQCDARNDASVRSLEKAGLRQEGHFREKEFVKGEWTDEIVFALLRSEWTRPG